jgi:hypothetical protein
MGRNPIENAERSSLGTPAQGDVLRLWNDVLEALINHKSE